jgi:hypothetical protein
MKAVSILSGDHMETNIDGLVIVFGCMCGYGVYKGLNIRKLSDWLFILPGLIMGLLLGSSQNDIGGGVKVGVLISTIVMISGVVIHKQRQLWGGGNKE